VFDTARTDFNFAQIFSENVYTGQDRIADADQLTAGVQSRFINANSGEQWLSMILAQRYYFHDQRVTLPTETPTAGRVADILAGLSGNVYRHVLLDAALQYDPREHNVQRTALGLRYQPDYAKVLSLSYHYTRGSLRDLDVTFQWPIWDRWYGVGRYNPNLRDHQTSEALVGLEYKADCWVFRGVWQNMLTQTTSSSAARHNNSYFIQIELNDFAALGNNPVSLLRRNVSGYGKINEPPLGNLVNSDDNSNSLF
jgi:LPS-assembly protein